MSAASSALEPMDAKLLTLQNLLDVLQLSAKGVAVFAGGDVTAGANIADGLLEVVQKSVAAYEAHTGKPIDPALIRPFVPIPVPVQAPSGEANAPQAPEAEPPTIDTAPV